jgi:hypothetical protein
VFSDTLRRGQGFFSGLVLIALSACQPVPQPFARPADAPANPLLVLTDSTGVVVLDVDGASPAVAEKLPAATVEALHAHNVPASTGSANTKSRFLFGQAETKSLRPGVLEVKLAWELVDPKGASIGRHVVTGRTSEAAWNAGSKELVQSFAKSSAGGIAALIQSPIPVKAARPTGLRPLFVDPVAGVSNEQGIILRQAMRHALRRHKITVPRIKSERDLVIAGRISLGAPQAGQQSIKIDWTVRQSGGEEIGNLKQANLIAEELMTRNWPDLAQMIADAAAPGVVEVVRRFRPPPEG